MSDFEYDFTAAYDFTTAAYEVEIMRLWDSLPDHVKTISLLQKVKRITESEYLQIVSKLPVHGDQENLA
jgi:hypothetical protein